VKARRRFGAYGVDAPPIMLTIAAIGTVLVLVGAALLWLQVPIVPWISLAIGLLFLSMLAIGLNTTLAGKFAVWEEIFGTLQLRGDEQVLDVGCGRGAVLVMAARNLSTGRATGVDIWSAADQTANTPAATRRNAIAEGVAGLVDLVTGDARLLPFGDASFDVVVSSMAIHNVRDRNERGAALGEVARVLRPGGRVALVDFMQVVEYPEVLQRHGMRDVKRRPLGWRFWYGSPQLEASLITGSKPLVAAR
jgi:SAM-dependent methyltransferase